MTGIDKAKAICEIHQNCTREQAREWLRYWAAIIYQDYGLAELYKAKEDIVNIYRQFYYREETEDAKHDVMERFNHREDEDEPQDIL